MSRKSAKDLRRQIAKLTAQNNRLREVIESFAGRAHVLHRHSEQSSQTTHIDAFEDFAPMQSPRLKMPRSNLFGSPREAMAEVNAWFPNVGNGLAPLEPAPGWRCLAAHNAPVRLGFNLTGHNAKELEEVVDAIEQRQLRDRDFIPVFITDASAFEVFRLRGYVFEYIPESIAQAPGNRRAERSYYRKRLGLIKEKWDLHDIVDLSR